MFEGTASLAPRTARLGPTAELLSLGADTMRIAERVGGPLLDLCIRLWLAQIFWVSGMIKLHDWSAALYLAANEYPVSWLNPVTAAWLGAATEVICPLFLALGLATRFAALPLLILSLVMQYSYLRLDQHLYWAILFSWYVVMGAGAISLDHRLARGAAQTALPFARPLASAFTRVTRWGEPAIKLLVRYWIASVFFASGLTKIIDFDATIFLFQTEYHVPLLPPELAAWLATATELTCPVLLVIGFCARLAALPLVVMALVINFTYQPHVDHLYWLMLLGLIVLFGPGAWSVDHYVGKLLRRRFPQLDGMSAFSLEGLPRVVIVGGGFGGIAAARALRKTPCRVTLIDRCNYHLFQPLLYQVATASLSPADIATPIRALFRDQHNVRVLLGQVTEIDTAAGAVRMDEARVPYDFLVLATGARHSYFGHDDWAPYAPGLKNIENATDVRRRLLVAFEQAENVDDPSLRHELLTFVIVGGGPTGVELAGAIAELARNGLAREFRSIDPATARVILVQSGPRILPTFPRGAVGQRRPGVAEAGRRGADGCGCRRGRPAWRGRLRPLHRRPHSPLGRRRPGLPGREVGQRRGGSGRPPQGRPGPVGARRSQCVRDRRHCPLLGVG
jgi:NADH dehydrogenase/putative oxidoreductase